jgi:hypothetical protein
MIPRPEQPKYKLTLPASKEVIEYRAFTVGEEKVLLLAMEEKNPERLVDALDQIFGLCTFGVCKLKEMTQVDAEFLFINIRNKSLGEGIEVTHKCHSCENKIETTLNLDDIKILDAERMDPNIKVSDTDIITLKYPTLDKTINLVDEEDPLLAVAKCIDMLMIGEKIYTKEETSLKDFVDYLNGLTQKQIDQLEKFFNTMPRIVFDMNYTCAKCGAQNNIHLEGLNDFFE